VSGHVLISGRNYTLAEKAEVHAALMAMAQDGHVQVVFGDEDAPDFLPGETWNDYGLRVYGVQADPGKRREPSPIPHRHRRQA
jgi:hypothetical protein